MSLWWKGHCRIWDSSQLRVWENGWKWPQKPKQFHSFLMFPTFRVARCHITFSKPMRLPSRYHAKGPIGAEALCRSMEANSSIYAIAMNIPYIDIIRYWIILISNRFLCSDFLHAIMLFSLFYSFHAIYVIFIEAGRFLYPGHEVGQFDDEKRDQMDMAHLACLSWKAGCLWHLFLDLARGVSWKCTVNFVRDGWFHQSSFWFLDKDEPVGTFWDDYFGNIISRNTIERWWFPIGLAWCWPGLLPWTSREQQLERLWVRVAQWEESLLKLVGQIQFEFTTCWHCLAHPKY